MKCALSTATLTIALGLLCRSADAQDAPPGGAAGELDDSTRAAARVLGEAGVELFHDGDYEGALAKFQKAEEIAAVPTLGVRIARCLDKLGRLLDARAKYEAVTAMTVDANAPRAQRDALEQARSELAALGPRIPALEISIVGPDVADAEVSIDGKLVSRATLGRVPVDPGQHRVVGRRGGDTASQEISVKESETMRVMLRFGARTESEAPRPVQLPDDPQAEPAGAAYRTGAWIALGAAAAGAGVFAITGGLALGKQSDLVERCPDDVCDASAEGDVRTYDTLRVVSIIGLATAAVGAGVAVTLFAIAPSHGAASARLEIRPGSLRLGGTF